MARRRFYVPEIVEGRAAVVGDDAHHLARVLRVEPGQHFEISDSKSVYLAEVSAVSKSAVQFRVLEALGSGPGLPPITLYSALIKFDRFEWMIEKATEIGVARIVPVEAARTDRGLFEAAGKRVERWRKVARESSQQSRRAAPPEIAGPVKLFPAATAAPGVRLHLEEQPGAPPLALIISATKSSTFSLLTGPEGGWTDDEQGRLAEANWQPVSLGPAILRAETAAIVAAAITAQAWFAGELMRHGSDALQSG